MRKYQNLAQLLKGYHGIADKAVFTDLLANDLEQAHCQIFGETIDDELVLLAELKFLEDSLSFSSSLFQKNIEFIVIGNIISDQYPALTYRVDTGTFQFFGRCSTIPQICGVDLYLDKSYTEKIGDCVKQKFTLPVTTLFKSIK